MMIDLYIIDQDTGKATLEIASVTLSSCFPEPDDEADMALVQSKIDQHGFAMFGGGAGALFRFEKAK